MVVVHFAGMNDVSICCIAVNKRALSEHWRPPLESVRFLHPALQYCDLSFCCSGSHVWRDSVYNSFTLSQ